MQYFSGVGNVDLGGVEFDTDTVTTFPVGPRGASGPSGSTAYNLPTARVATTGNVASIATANSPTPIDGVSPANGDLVLVWQQTNANENGLYTWNAGAPMTRHSTAAASVTLESGTRVYVTEGTVFGARDFYLKARQTIGSGAVSFSPPRGASIAFQRFYFPGGAGSMAGLSNANNGQIITDGTGVYAQLFYTPPVNVEASCRLHLRLSATQASYVYAMPGLRLTPTDRDGIGGPAGSHQFALIQMHTSVQTYEPIQIDTTYRLAAGTAYTLDAITYVAAGWTGSISTQRPEFWMDMRAFVSA